MKKSELKQHIKETINEDHKQHFFDSIENPIIKQKMMKIDSSFNDLILETQKLREWINQQ